MANLYATEKKDDKQIPRIKDIVGYFPIGESVTYYPEFQASMTMQTIVLGYEINGYIIYSQNQLEILTSTKGNSFITLHVEDKEHEFKHIDTFCILLPGKAGEEYKLNYLSKASLGSRGQFRNGNAITLITRHHSRGMIMLETQVRESHIPKTGVYRSHQLVMLDTGNFALEYSEQRTHHRLATRVPVHIQQPHSNEQHACMLANYSEVHLQIKFNSDDTIAKLIKAGSSVTLTIKLEHLHKTFIVGGIIMRKQKDSAIFTMQEVFDGNQPRSFALMDALDIKACLLQHPGTQ